MAFVAHPKRHLLQPLRQVALGAFLRLVQSQLIERLDPATVRHYFERLLPPGMVRNAQRILTGAFATGNQTEALPCFKKHLGTKRFVQDGADMFQHGYGFANGLSTPLRDSSARIAPTPVTASRSDRRDWQKY